jgi:cell division protein FtsL
MIVQSPLKKRATRPNLRKVPLPDIESPSSFPKGKRTSGKKAAKSVKQTIQGIKPWKVILATITIGIFGFLYLTHVFATQKLLEEVQTLESEYNKVRSQHDALKLQYDRMVGPAEIYNKAEQAGFINGGPADKLIEVKK